MKNMLQFFSPARLLLLACLVLLAACSMQPPRERTSHTMLPADEILDTTLGKAVAERTAKHPGMSGIQPLADALDAFSARVFLARMAEKTLDVQYYIWRKDTTGTVLLHELYQAAERGVRVRLLLDDNGISGMDDWLALLNSHPNLEVRLFNPFALRKARMLGFITDFSRANRRMHNKSYTADQSITITGGRNVGDEYFAATDGLLFADLDVIAAGPAAVAISEDFDRYWASQSAYPVDQLFQRNTSRETLANEASAILGSEEAARYAAELMGSGFRERLLSGDMQMEWVKTRLVSDDPAKGLGKAEVSDLMIYSLAKLLGKPERSLDLVSPYFVPTKAGVEVFSALAREGIEVRILTNALEATDVAAVHSGYAKRRKALLKAGVLLYEMQSNAVRPDGGSAGIFGSSGSSLHAKTFAIDGERVFIGSFNFDPRSANLNTELGFVIESKSLAEATDRVFTKEVPIAAYQVKLDDRGRVYWLQHSDTEPLIYHTEPNVGWLKRAGVKIMSWLPIEWLL